MDSCINEIKFFFSAKLWILCTLKALGLIILEAIGVPSAGIALILGVDRILDMMRTVTNVTGDASVAVAVASTENQLKI